MITFKYLEEYIEYIAGSRDKNNRASSSFFCTPPISLARYDKGVLSSFANQLENNTGFTDRQSELAIKIVDKYRRQLAKQDVEVPLEVDKLPLKYPVRKVDRSLTLYIEDGFLKAKFPYTTTIINDIKSHAGDKTGFIEFDRVNKTWNMSLTEPNVLWMYDIASNAGFAISDEIKNLYQSIKTESRNNFKIELMLVNGDLTLCNAPDSMLEYIKDNVGVMSLDNLQSLVDLSARLGFSLHESISDRLPCEKLVSKKENRLPPTKEGVQEIVDFVTTYNKFPIVSFKTALLGDEAATYLNNCFEKSEVKEVTSKKIEQYNEHTKLVHADSYGIKELAKSYSRIPLLVLYGNLSYGSANEYALQLAERVVYCCDKIFDDEI